MDSDEDEASEDDKVVKDEDVDIQDISNATLSPDDARRQGEISEGVQKIKVSALKEDYV